MASNNIIRIAVLANGAQAKRELSGVAGAAAKMESRFAKFRMPATLALGAIAVGGKKAIDAAGDLNEEISKSGEIFGKQAGGIEKFASGAATSLGQSKIAALDATSTFGQIAQKAGLGGKASADFAKKFTGLASDLASFNNTSPEEAIEAIGSAMRGESEPIRKYGVMLDDATLRARALEMGLIKTTKNALTPQQKALASSAEIMAQTTKAQGDFARTSDGAANKQRIIAARVDNLTASLGQALLPTYEKVLQILSKVVGWMTQNTTAVQAGVVAVGALSAVLLTASVATKVYAAGLAVYNAVTKAITVATKVWTVAQRALNIAMISNPIGLVVVAIVALVAIFIVAYKKSETFRNIVDKAFAAVKKAAASVATFFTTKVPAAFNRVKDAASKVLSWVKGNWPKILMVLTGPFGLAVGLIVKNWDRIKSSASAAKDFVVGRFNALVSFIKGVPGKVRGSLSSMWDGIKSGFQSAMNWVIDKWNGLSFSLPKVDLGPLGSFGGGTFRPPQIPRLAKGGITTGPTLAMIGDNPGGREAVIPLDKYDIGGSRTYNIQVVAPVGASSADIGRDLVQHIDAFEKAGGRRKA